MNAAYVKALSLAAAPTFAAMAVVTGTVEHGAVQSLCGGMAASPLGGMTFMYALMSAFHITPWLRLINRHWSLHHE
jgi:hypothetical protein